MRKLVSAIAAAGVGAMAVAALGAAHSSADPSSNSTLNVVGEPYAKAVAILRAQGIPTIFGGSVGGDVPQSQCIVTSQKVTGSKMKLMVNCTAAAQPVIPAAPTTAGSSPGTAGTQAPDAGSRPTAGAPGVVTVVPTRVG